MKILVCCNGGFSSSLIESKVIKYAESVGDTVEINACGTDGVEEEIKNGYEVLLYAPQVRNRAKMLKGLADGVGIPCDQMNPQDYAFSNGEKIYKQAKALVG